MKNSKFKDLSNESLLGKKNNFGKGLVVLIVLLVALLVLGINPSLLGDNYPSNNYFRIPFVICFVLIYQVYKDWNSAKKEIEKRNLDN